MCSLLAVSRSGYYGSLKKTGGKRHALRRAVADLAEKFHRRSRRIYGYRKIHADIVGETPIRCCPETVRRAMRERSLSAEPKRSFQVTTRQDGMASPAPNLLQRDFSASGPNRKWVADITYIPTREGWLYLAGVMDLYSRAIVGWSVSSRMESGLPSTALNMALRERRPAAGLIHHSDRGMQYTSEAYQSILRRCGVVCSMSRSGDCWDNAVQESFWGKLKREWIRGKVYGSRAEAKTAIAEYIEVFYNHFRRHESLGYVAPMEFEKNGGDGSAA